MGCERGGNYKRRNTSESNNSSKDIYSMKNVLLGRDQ